MRSPLEISYDEVAANPRICLENPISRTRDLFGNILLWEGRQNERDLKSPVFRVVQARDGSLKFFKLDKRYNEWVQISRLEPRRFFRRKQDDVMPGVVRIEVFANGRVKRTVG